MTLSKRLIEAAKSGNMSKNNPIECYLANQGDINAVDSYGYTLLHYTVSEGHQALAEFLLTYPHDSANPNIKSRWDGYIPLHLAIIKKNLACIDCLLNHPVEINSKDLKGKTPLHHAVELLHCESVQRLIDAKASVNCRDNEYYTPLHNLLKSNTEMETRKAILMLLSQSETIDYGLTHFDGDKIPLRYPEYGMNHESCLVESIEQLIREADYYHKINLHQKIDHLENQMSQIIQANQTPSQPNYSATFFRSTAN